MPAPSSAAWAAASSSAMKATRPAVAVRCGAQQKVDAAPGHRLTQAGKLAGLVAQPTVNALSWSPSPARGPARRPALNLPGRRADNRPAMPGRRPPRMSQPGWFPPVRGRRGAGAIARGLPTASPAGASMAAASPQFAPIPRHGGVYFHDRRFRRLGWRAPAAGNRSPRVLRTRPRPAPGPPGSASRSPIAYRAIGDTLAG
jgi:hypothetical protein